ncbi:MAG TPA: hypothetical protein PKV67_15460 [Hyphomonas sp.]|nr:hypothetical protein [Hyphomonas sp.]HRJ02145.1 hypothetical protein [Hyphomonas sp.]HRK66623.1 hypothetical protein [Hyphomonas sp.]
MKTDVMTLSLLMVAGSPAAAMAQGCTEAETALRAEARILGPMLTEMTTITNDYNAKQKQITDLYDYLYYYYLDITASEQEMVNGLEAGKAELKVRYDELMSKALPYDAKVTDLTKAYEAACAPTANAAALLNEYDIRILTDAEKAQQ